MALIGEASELVGSPLGGLVTYGLVLLAVLAAMGMVWGEQRRTQSETARRMAWALGALFLVRVTYALTALVATLGYLDLESVLPPMERLVDVVSIGFLAWAFLPGATQRARPWEWVVGANLALAVGAYLAFVVFWAQALATVDVLNYNDFWQDTVWTAWKLVLAALAGLAAIRGRGRGWGAFLFTMLILSAGALVQWILPVDVLHVQVWQRLANLVAYPLVAVAVYQEIVSGMQVQSLEMQDISQASMDQMKSLLNLFAASRQTSSSLDLPIVLDSAVRGIADVLQADQCAIVFPEEDGTGTMRLVAIHNPTRQGRGEEVTFPLEYQLKVQQAIRRRKPVIVDETGDVQLKVLFALMGSPETGPLLVQPLLSGRDAIGAIIAGNSRSRRPFTPNDSKLCQSMAEQVATSIQNARRYQFAQSQIEELGEAQQEAQAELRQAGERIKEFADSEAKAHARVEELEEQEQVAREARKALEIQLISSRAELDRLSERAATLEHTTEPGSVPDQAPELERLSEDWERAVSALQSVQSVLRGMPAGVIVSDVQGEIQQANVAAKQLLEAQGGELVGRNIEEVFADARWRQSLDAAREGSPSQLILSMGSKVVVCDVAPVLGHQQDGVRLVAVFQEGPVESAGNGLRLEALTSLAEELRSPITTVNNYADLLLSESVGSLGSSQRKFLTRIKANAERMRQMADDLFHEGQGDAEEATSRQQSVELATLIEETVAQARCQMEDRELTLDLVLAKDLPVIHAEPGVLQRVLSNLLSNACLASTVGGRVQVEATLATAAPQALDMDLNDGEYVIVSVSDSGSGLSGEELERVFDRSRPSQTPPGVGESGASLALVKMMIEARGGKIWVQSREGKGTTFGFAVPVLSEEPPLEPTPGEGAA